MYFRPSRPLRAAGPRVRWQIGRVRAALHPIFHSLGRSKGETSTKPLADMPLPRELLAFVQAAVRLPPDRLRRVERGWDSLQEQRALVAGLVQSSEDVRNEVMALRDYVLAEARRAVADLPDDAQIPEDIVEAVFPTARVLLLRRMLEDSGDPGRAEAYRDLTRPFADIIQR